MISTEAKVLSGVSIVTVIIVIAGALFFGGKPDKQKEILPASDMQYLVRENSNKIAVPNAKVTIVEFADFQCPACAMQEPVVNKILQEYKEKVTYVFRHYPLPVHANSRIAAHAAEAAGAQNKFFEMGDKLFTHQKDWAESKKPLDEFVIYAKQLKLNGDEFKKAVENKIYEDKIRKDQADGNALRVNATPTFFINGEKIEGVIQYDKLKDKIENALKES